jgi:rhodanese-related sulfurtransferase/DNA-binding transcriptional ArsR family regulator
MNNRTKTDKRTFKDDAYGQIARIGKAVSSPKRLELVDLLCQTERTVEDLAEETGMSIANTSQHLQILDAARLVQSRKRGRFVVYSIAHALVGEFFRVLRGLAEKRLAELEQIRARFLHSRGDLSPVHRDTLIKRVRSGKVVVIDVRPLEEYRTAHIPRALSIPLKELKRRISELPASKEIVAYCRGPFCVLAIDAVRLLRSKGLRAHRLEASVHDWEALGFPVITGDDPARAPVPRGT